MASLKQKKLQSITPKKYKNQLTRRLFKVIYIYEVIQDEWPIKTFKENYSDYRPENLEQWVFENDQ